MKCCGEDFEVTTFRTDGRYSDGRHPDQVTFAGSIREDLARRDFTINAIAMEKDGRILDLYGGISDLKGETVRCVGNARIRFGRMHCVFYERCALPQPWALP